MTSNAVGRGTVLLVEDDPALAAMLRDRLSSRGYRVWHAESAAAAESAVDAVEPAVIILDLMLPDMHGLVLCANLRERVAAPIIICSATKRKDDGVLAFKLGAVDFVPKPFSSDELEVRIEAALRSAAPGTAAPTPAPEDAVQVVGPLAIDRGRCTVTLGGNPIRLTPTEYRLLCALADRPNYVHSAKDLAERIWGAYDLGIRRSLEVHLRRLRAKLNGGPVSPPALRAVRGLGYQLAWEPASNDGAAT